MKEAGQIWIKAGYKLFALSGESALKVETLARLVSISKSSFYHHFADMDVFIEHLMHVHLRQCSIMADKERTVNCIDPELIHILIEHKYDLLFNRQLRFNQHYKQYGDVLEKSNQTIGNEFVTIWRNDLQLNLTQLQLEGLFELALENFFLQINIDTLHYTWLSGYFRNLRRIARTLG